MAIFNQQRTWTSSGDPFHAGNPPYVGHLVRAAMGRSMGIILLWSPWEFDFTKIEDLGEKGGLDMKI